MISNLAAASPPPTSRRRRSRGQGVVEFALVLPVLLLLLLVSIDFGRVYLGWVNLQNMTRIAANFAANNASDFATANPATLTQYQNQILNDAQKNNCQLHNAAGVVGQADPPVFSGYDLGDTATVSLSCTFRIVTPVISNILGSSITVSASSDFPVKSAIIAASNSGGGGGGGGTFVAASFSCTPKSGAVPLPIQCNDESGGNPDSWSWTINGPGGSIQTSTSQDPTFTLPTVGSYSVTLVADNALKHPSTLTLGNYITVGAPSQVDFTADHNSGKAPLTVTFTDTSTNNPTTWAWDFQNDGIVDSTIQKPTFKYLQDGRYDVKLTVTNAAGSAFTLKQNFIVVSVGDCTVPSFTGVQRSDAQALWGPSGAGFTTIVQDAPQGPQGNGYTIGFQSITAGSVVPCNSVIQVSN
jgi:PKD repeat protein